MQPSLLIASPQMKDPFFEHTVVLVWHHDEDGAIGVVVNRVGRELLPEVLVVEDIDMSAYEGTRVAWGGPVETGFGTLITSSQISAEEGWILPGGLSVTQSQDALERLLRARADVLLCMGYAGWGAGQLDQEIADGGWLFTDCTAELIFDTPPDSRYAAALATLGLTPNALWMAPIAE